MLLLPVPNFRVQQCKHCGHMTMNCDVSSKSIACSYDVRPYLTWALFYIWIFILWGSCGNRVTFLRQRSDDMTEEPTEEWGFGRVRVQLVWVAQLYSSQIYAFLGHETSPEKACSCRPGILTFYRWFIVSGYLVTKQRYSVFAGARSHWFECWANSSQRIWKIKGPKSNK